MSTLKVDNIRHNSATSDAITMASDGTCTAKLTSVGGGQLSHRNIIINGAMNVAQRGVTSTNTGYQTVDRFSCGAGGVNEAPTFAQVDVANGTTPYTLGFRKSLKITNGNQTSLDTGDEINIVYNIEAQDLIASGWNYKSSSSFATWSFWIKSSVAQNFRGYIRTYDNTATAYAFETGTLSANTWTKIVRTIPGNSGLDIDNDNGTGLQIRLLAYIGTAYTDNSTPTHSWVTYNSSARTPDNTSTWYQTNDATLEITGYQFEVGDTATSFEHRTYQDEFLRCCRYYQQLTGDDRGYNGGGSTGSFKNSVIGIYNSATDVRCIYYHMVPMRDSPTFTLLGAVSDFDLEPFDRAPSSIASNRMSPFQSTLLIADSTGATTGNACQLTIDQAAGGLAFSAEL